MGTCRRCLNVAVDGCSVEEGDESQEHLAVELTLGVERCTHSEREAKAPA